MQALETLAVIAYKQPVTAAEIAEIRGVSSSGGVLSTLVERRLIKTVGRKQVVGRPFMYATTREFLERFGLNDLSDLPKVEEMSDALGFELPGGACRADADDVAAAVRVGAGAESASGAEAESGQSRNPCRRGIRRRHAVVTSIRLPRRSRAGRRKSALSMAERLQKILSAAGIASRRAAEALIEQGRVSVNGTTVTELGTKADPDTDEIRVDGRRVKAPQRRRYILLYKPRGYITSRSDPEQRPTVIDLLTKGGVREYVYPVGRLDYESEGLLLLTSDGDLAARLTHPSHGVAREYEVRVRGVPDDTTLDRLSRGIVARRAADRAGAASKLKKVIEMDGGLAGAAVVRDPRGPQSPGARDVRSGRPSGGAPAPRPHRPDHRRPHPAGRVPRPDGEGSRRAAQDFGGRVAASASSELDGAPRSTAGPASRRRSARAPGEVPTRQAAPPRSAPASRSRRRPAGDRPRRG